MNKLIGYASITIGGKIIPVKLGIGAMRTFLNEYGIELHQVMPELFDSITVTIDGEEKLLPKPKDPFKFAASLLWAGADYCNRLEGGEGYTIFDAYEWLDELGGIAAEPVKAVYVQFFKAMRNGGTPPKEVEFTDQTKKKATKKSS